VRVNVRTRIREKVGVRVRLGLKRVGAPQLELLVRELAVAVLVEARQRRGELLVGEGAPQVCTEHGELGHVDATCLG